MNVGVPTAGANATFCRHATDSLYLPFLEVAGAWNDGMSEVGVTVVDHLKRTGRWVNLPIESGYPTAYHTIRVKNLSKSLVSIRIGLEGYAVTSYILDLDPDAPEEKEDGG